MLTLDVGVMSRSALVSHWNAARGLLPGCLSAPNKIFYDAGFCPAAPSYTPQTINFRSIWLSAVYEPRSCLFPAVFQSLLVSGQLLNHFVVMSPQFSTGLAQSPGSYALLITLSCLILVTNSLSCKARWGLMLQGFYLKDVGLRGLFVSFSSRTKKDNNTFKNVVYN